MKRSLFLAIFFIINGSVYSQQRADTLASNIAQLMQMGDEARLNFDFSKALGHYNSVLKLDSMNSRAKELASDMYSSLGEHGVSVRLLRNIYKDDTTNTRVISKLALSLQAQQQTREAANLYKLLISMKSSNFNTVKSLADCYWTLGKRDSAEVYYKVADFIYGKSLVTKLYLSQIAYINKDFSSAKIYASRGVELDSSYVPLRKQLGLTHYRLDEYKQALTHFNYLAEQGDSTSSTLKMLGACNFFLGEFDKAVPLLRKTLVTDSTDTEALFYLGSSLSHKGEAKEAVEIFNSILSILQPDPSLLHKLHNQLGIAYSALEQNQTALESFSLAYKYNPSDSKLLFQMAMVRGGLKDKGNLTEAKKLLERYLSAIEPKGHALSAEEVILRERAKMYIERINEDLFMNE